jgi:hypothetical protein
MVQAETAMFCYRPNGTCYAVIAPSEWTALRKAGKLEAELKRRDSGTVIEVKRPEGFKSAPHFKPRTETTVERAPLNFAERHADTLAAMRATTPDPKTAEYATVVQWREGLSYPGNDPENGPARRVPVNGCRECGNDDADSYDESGLGSCCQGDDETDADESAGVEV